MRALTATTVLALHALHLMMRQPKPVTVREISRSSGSPIAEVRRILARLRRADLLHSRPGKGFVLGRAPGEISLQEVVRVLDKPQTPTAPCGGNYDACASRSSCVFAPLCRAAEESFQNVLRAFTLADLMATPPDLPNCVGPRLKPPPAEAS